MARSLNIQRAKEASIIDYLRSIGIEPEYTTGSTAFYFSPWRKETVPSLGVSLHRNKWKDFGENMKMSDVLDLIQKIEKCSLAKAVDIALGKTTGTTPAQHEPPPPSEKRKYIEIKATETLSDRNLWSYISGRGISVYTASKYLSQLRIVFPYSKTNSTKEHLVVGFRNDSGGYEMRSSYLKVCNSPKTITTIRGDDKHVILFEGFFDYLSFVEMYGEPTEKVVVLNSTSFMPSIAPFLSGCTVYSFVDNDNAGDACIRILYDNGIPFADCRYIYEEYNDLNQYWTNTQKNKTS